MNKYKKKVKGKWQYFDGDRRITEAEYNAPKKKESSDKTVECVDEELTIEPEDIAEGGHQDVGSADDF